MNGCILYTVNNLRSSLKICVHTVFTQFSHKNYILNQHNIHVIRRNTNAIAKIKKMCRRKMYLV